MELRTLANFLESDEERFVAILERKTNKNLMAERKSAENALQTAITRNEEVSRLYERIYEDNVNGKISDESPVGKALLGHHVGETVETETPSGMIQFEILEIQK